MLIGMDVVIPDLNSMPLERVLVSRKRLRRALSSQPDLQPVRIAVLGGSTTQELVDLLELTLLASGFLPVFYQSEFGRYQSEAVHDAQAVTAFRPDLVYLHTSQQNIESFPSAGATEADLDLALESELDRFRQIWRSLSDGIGCQIIQNNFELPPYASLGSLDAVLPAGRTRFITELNARFSREAALNPRLLLHDLCSLSARLGLDRWFAPERYFSYKIPTSPEASYACARSLAALVRAVFGRARKVLVLDLDNTLWGGVVGDDGVDALHLGRETPLAEAFTAFGEYCLRLREQGILLAVCSKNDLATARAAFAHPDAVLKLHHFSAFKANWRPKHENILEIAAELNLAPESFVFVDDNPAERALVAAQIPGILVPDLPEDPAGFPAAIEALHPFHQAAQSTEDLERALQYGLAGRRSAQQATFANYAEYLASLEMSAEIEPFSRVYLDRITQLVNKTNQFNLTTQRFTFAEMESVLRDPGRLGLYARLTDRFGENGLISVVVGSVLRQSGAPDTLDLELWVMSCRVLKRDVECAMLDALVEHARALDVSSLTGHFRPTRKNAMVADLYPRLGFRTLQTFADGSADYLLPLTGYQPRNTHIRVDSLALQGSMP